MRPDAYPKNWKAISASIRARAGDKCEQCGAPNHTLIWRKRGTAEYILDPMDDRDGFDIKATLVVLTVHHIGMDYPDGQPGNPRDKMDSRPENLICLCQRCHLLADLPIHMANRKKTNARKKAERAALAGQQEMFK